MLAVFARAADPSSGGRQPPAHYGHRRLKIITHSGAAGAQIAHAAGVGLAEKIKGGDAVAWVSFGAGAASRGDFHEGVGLAAAQRLPVIFQCESDGPIAGPEAEQTAFPSVAGRAAAYGIPGIAVDGGDALATYTATRAAVARARAGQGPTLIEARCITFTRRSGDDGDRPHRPADAIKRLRALDPIGRFRDFLREHGALDGAVERDLRAWIKAEVDDATTFAENAPLPEPSTLTRHVYAE
jgi:2-oxoisovalerate dehydrogenase E1 component alpha subunit